LGIEFFQRLIGVFGRVLNQASDHNFTRNIIIEHHFIKFFEDCDGFFHFAFMFIKILQVFDLQDFLFGGQKHLIEIPKFN
jgi:hypothetical protein